MFPEVGRSFLEQRAAGSLVPEPLEPPQGNGNGDHEFGVDLSADDTAALVAYLKTL